MWSLVNASRQKIGAVGGGSLENAGLLFGPPLDEAIAQKGGDGNQANEDE
jgi:hypothetical protein